MTMGSSMRSASSCLVARIAARSDCARPAPAKARTNASVRIGMRLRMQRSDRSVNLEGVNLQGLTRPGGNERFGRAVLMTHEDSAVTVRIRLLVLLAYLAILAGAPDWSAAPVGAQTPVTELRQLAYLKASNSEGADHFGCGGSLPGHIGNALAVSGDGNTVVVGAPHESSGAVGINGNQDDNSLYNSGAVYVYVRRGDTWTQQSYLKASNPGRSDLFGLSLALSRDGNTL